MENQSDRHLGMQIQRMLVQEVGGTGADIFNKQCQELGLRQENIKLNDLVLLSQRMIRELRPMIGNAKAQKVGKDIQKFKILAELNALAGIKGDPMRDKKELDAYSKLGSICYTVGDWDEALDYYKKVKILSRRIDDRYLMAEAYRNTGHIFKRRGNWGVAIENLEKGLALSRDQRHPLGMADAYRGLGYAYWRRGEYQKAKDQLDQAVDLAEESRDKAMMGVIQLETALVYGDIGEEEKAIDYYLRSIDLLDSAMDYEQLSRAYNNLGDIYLVRGDWPKALEFFDLCIETAGKIYHRLWIAWSLFNSAEVLARTGKPDEAIERCNESLEMLQKADDYVALTAVKRNLGLAYSLKGEWDEAEKWFRESEKTVEKVTSPLNVAHLYLEWGNMNILKGDKKMAKEYLDDAKQRFEKLGAKRYLQKTKESFSRL